MKRTGLCMIVAAAMAVVPTTAQAVKGPAAWVSRHGLTSAQYQDEFDTWGKAGYRLQQVSGYVDDGVLRYAALWRKLSGKPWVAVHGLSSSDYQKAFDKYGKKGYRLTWVDGYGVNGSARYAAIWVKRTGPAWQAFHGLTSTQYQNKFDKLTRKGWRLTHVSGYGVGGTAQFAAIFEKSSGPAGITHHAMTADEFQKDYDDYNAQGYTIKEISGYYAGGEDLYAAIWEKSGGGPVLRARFGIPGSSYQRTADTDYYQTYYPTFIQAFSSGGSAKFNVIELTPMGSADLTTIKDGMNGFLAKQHVAGVSIAVAKNGRLVYASGFGLADLADNVPLDVDHRLRIGSISKTITSAALYQLVEDGKLSSIDRHVLGADGVLSGIKVPASMATLEDATIAQFLEHESGLPGSGSGDDCVARHTPCNLGDPTDCSKSTLNGRLQAELFRHAQEAKDQDVPALLGKPGERIDYSNYSHNLLGQVIAKLAGMPYERYVLRRVFRPSGITTPRLFRTGDYDPSSGESQFYDVDGNYADYGDGCDSKPPGIAAGGWAMTARDLLRYLISVDNVKARNILTMGDYTDMLKIVNPTLDGPTNYAKSWAVGPIYWCGKVHDVIQGHNGGLAGGWGQLWSLANGYSIAVLGNQDTGAGKCTLDADDKSTPDTCKDGGCSDDATAILIDMLDKIDWTNQDLFG